MAGGNQHQEPGFIQIHRSQLFADAFRPGGVTVYKDRHISAQTQTQFG